jgi:hypothetical protein
MITKKHYIAIAEIVNKYIWARHYNPIDLVNDLIRVFKSDNPNFDKLKFIEACGLWHPDMDKKKHKGPATRITDDTIVVGDGLNPSK